MAHRVSCAELSWYTSWYTKTVSYPIDKQLDKPNKSGASDFECLCFQTGKNRKTNSVNPSVNPVRKFFNSSIFYCRARSCIRSEAERNELHRVIDLTMTTLMVRRKGTLDLVPGCCLNLLTSACATPCRPANFGASDCCAHQSFRQGIAQANIIETRQSPETRTKVPFVKPSFLAPDVPVCWATA
jgi:hypothetical protein